MINPLLQRESEEDRTGVQIDDEGNERLHVLETARVVGGGRREWEAAGSGNVRSEAWGMPGSQPGEQDEEDEGKINDEDEEDEEEEGSDEEEKGDEEKGDGCVESERVQEEEYRLGHVGMHGQQDAVTWTGSFRSLGGFSNGWGNGGSMVKGAFARVKASSPNFISAVRGTGLENLLSDIDEALIERGL
ncbi:unnamed protein product [Closterium sp. NIES-53]